MSELAVLAIIPNIVAVIIGIALALEVRGHSPAFYRRSIFIVFVLIAVNSTILAMESFTSELDLHLMLVIFDYATGVGLMVSLLVFTMQYVGFGRRVTKRNILLWSMPGMAVILMIATNQWHHLYYVTTQMVEFDGLYLMKATYGPLFLIWIAYWSIILILCVTLMVKALSETTAVRRPGFMLIITALLVYIVFGVAHSLVVKSPYVNMLAIGMSISAVLIFQAERRSGIINQHHISIREAIQEMDDGVMVTDTHGRLIYANEHAKRILARNDLTSFTGPDVPVRTDMRIETENGTREYSVIPSPVQRIEDTIGRIIVLHDITNRKEMEESLENANHRLDTMTRIVRHDILNDLLVLYGHLEMLRSTDLNEKQLERIGRIGDAIGRIGDHVRFTGEYQMIGSSEPSWQDLGAAIEYVQRRADLDGVTLRNNVNGAQVLADPMLHRVFHNLLDNSIRHGGDVRNISISANNTGTESKIIWEDDGVGVHPQDKERIFQCGYGRNTGQGLFLVQEILAMTGMSITECGVPGEGARFEISVPPTHFRNDSLGLN